MVNPFSALVWAWRILRGHSITFAALFGCSVLGVSALSTIRDWLSRGGAPWYVWLVVPGALIVLIARKEAEWVPDLSTRRRWARGIFFGSLLVSAAVAYFRPDPPASERATKPPPPAFHKIPR